MLPKLCLLEIVLAICKLPPDAPVPAWAIGSDFFSLTRTGDELSIVCLQSLVPHDVLNDAGASVESDWRAIKVQGPLDFSLTGIVSGLTSPLADAQIPVFVISTFDTDYLLVPAADLQRALDSLKNAGYLIAL